MPKIKNTTSHTHRYSQWIESLPTSAQGHVKDDLRVLHALLEDSDAWVQVKVNASSDAFSLRIFSRHAQLTLAEIMPVVHSFRLEALREDVFHLPHKDGHIWLHVLTCANPSKPLTKDAVAELERALALCLMRREEVDSLCSLVRRGLPLRALTLLRALSAYAQQLDGTANPWLMRRVLRHHPVLARHVWELFVARHGLGLTDAQRNQHIATLSNQTREVLAALPTVDDDRLASLLLEIVQACVRTNFWQDKGAALAFKIDCSKLPSMPSPKPWREIFVYGGAEFEGIHLRDGRLARGGIRYSDRLQDYRTEVLALQQTQVAKNVIIVPTGAKGGFVVKLPLPREKGDVQTLVSHTYKAYIQALLSVTDNRLQGTVVAPLGVVRHDTDDPYLVVAADKGTATFSDMANEVALAADYWPRKKTEVVQGFWLGDAFASGGKHGYDHKEMGITSRGAWVSVQHHLQTLEIAPSAKRPLTLVGIGDMSGDVFGNGLLREKHMTLLAAFNHQHIFIDPTPNPANSYAERQRLFNAKGGWDGYNPKKLSPGGAVLARDARTVELSVPAQNLLGFTKKHVKPDDVIKAILQLEVDVLWNGGIGTYMKASRESHSDVADRANDRVRVDAKQVRAKVIGEGGNLGITA